MIAYNVQIVFEGTSSLDGITPLPPQLLQEAMSSADSGTIVVTVPVGQNFGLFDPGELTTSGLVRYYVLESLSLVSEGVATHAPGVAVSIVSPDRESGGAGVSSTLVDLGAVAGGSGLVPFKASPIPQDHKLSFRTVADGNAGPHVIQLTLVFPDPSDFTANVFGAKEDSSSSLALCVNPPAALAVGQSGSTGAAADASPCDHQHAVPIGTPVELTDSTNADGASGNFADAEHQHAHGARGGGTLHAEATTSVAGFLSAADKTKLDNSLSGATNGLSVTLATNPSTSSAVFQDGFSGSNLVVVEAGTYEIAWEGNIMSSSGNTQAEVGVAVNGIVVPDAARDNQGRGVDERAMVSTTITALVATDVVTGMFRKTGGPGSVTLGQRRLTIMKVNI